MAIAASSEALNSTALPHEYDQPSLARQLGLSHAAAGMAVASTAVLEESAEDTHTAQRLPYHTYNHLGKPLLAHPSREQVRALETASPRVTVIDPHRPLPTLGEDVVLRTSTMGRLGHLRALRMPPFEGVDEPDRPTIPAQDGRSAFVVLVQRQLVHELHALRIEHGLPQLKISAGAIIAMDKPFWAPVEKVGPYDIGEYIPNIRTVFEPHRAHHDTQGTLETLSRNASLPADTIRRLTVGIHELRHIVSQRYPDHANNIFGIVRAYHPSRITETMRYGARPHPGDGRPDSLLHVFITPYVLPDSAE